MAQTVSCFSELKPGDTMTIRGIKYVVLSDMRLVKATSGKKTAKTATKKEDDSMNTTSKAKATKATTNKTNAKETKNMKNASKKNNTKATKTATKATETEKMDRILAENEELKAQVSKLMSLISDPKSRKALTAALEEDEAKPQKKGKAKDSKGKAKEEKEEMSDDHKKLYHEICNRMSPHMKAEAEVVGFWKKGAYTKEFYKRVGAIDKALWDKVDAGEMKIAVAIKAIDNVIDTAYPIPKATKTATAKKSKDSKKANKKR